MELEKARKLIQGWVEIGSPLCRLSGYYLIDVLACNNKLELFEIVDFYRHILVREKETVLHISDGGYKVVPPEISIIKIIEESSLDLTYKRYWMDALVEYEGVKFNANLMWHLHDGASDCTDECWITV